MRINRNVRPVQSCLQSFTRWQLCYAKVPQAPRGLLLLLMRVSLDSNHHSQFVYHPLVASSVPTIGRVHGIYRSQKGVVEGRTSSHN